MPTIKSEIPSTRTVIVQVVCWTFLIIFIVLIEGVSRHASVAGLFAAWVFGVIQIVAFAYTANKTYLKEKKMLETLVQTQKLDSIGSLAGGIAHDMNNVLATVLAISGMLPKDKNVALLEKAALKGKDLVTKLTGFSRRHISEMIPVDVTEVIRQDVEILKRTTLQKIKIVSHISQLPNILGSASDISNAFMNVCINAIDAMPDGGTLIVGAETIGGSIRIWVQDTGIGIPEKNLSRIMDPFFTTKEVGKGTGLGMSIIQTVINAHKGQLTIESKIGFGTLVTFIIPVLNGHKIEKIVQAPLIHETFDILLIDDDDLVREATQIFLESIGHTVTTACSGKNGIDLLRDSDYDFVILDYNMPVMNGTETLSIIRETHPHLPVILASGYLDMDEMIGDDYTTLAPKPYAIKDLIYALTQVRLKTSNKES